MKAFEVRFVKDPAQQALATSHLVSFSFRVLAKDERDAFDKGLGKFLPGALPTEWARLADVAEVRQLS